MTVLPAESLAQAFARGDDARPKPPQAFTGEQQNRLNGSFGGTYLRGNVDHIALNAGLDSKLTLAPRHPLFLEGSLNFVAFDGVPKMEKLKGSVLYAYELTAWFNPYAQSTHARNRFLELDYRTTNGVGVCFHSLLGDAVDPFLLSAAPTFEYERFDGGDVETSARGTFRFNVGLPLHSNVKLSLDTFYVPAFHDLDDYRLYAELVATFTVIDDLLSSRVAITDEYDSMPRSGVEPNDFGLMHSLVLHASW